jgi:hypothetical protein
VVVAGRRKAECGDSPPVPLLREPRELVDPVRECRPSPPCGTSVETNELGREPLSLVGVSPPMTGLVKEWLPPDGCRCKEEVCWRSRGVMWMLDVMDDLRELAKWLVPLEERRLPAVRGGCGDPGSRAAVRRTDPAEIVGRICVMLLPSKPAKVELRFRFLRSSLNQSLKEEKRLDPVRCFAVPAPDAVEEGLDRSGSLAEEEDCVLLVSAVTWLSCEKSEPSAGLPSESTDGLPTELAVFGRSSPSSAGFALDSEIARPGGSLGSFSFSSRGAFSGDDAVLILGFRPKRAPNGVERPTGSPSTLGVSLLPNAEVARCKMEIEADRCFSRFLSCRLGDVSTGGVADPDDDSSS